MREYDVRIGESYTSDDGYEDTVPAPDGWGDIQVGDCPDCGGQWVWAEAGLVPGARECTQCGSRFSAEPLADGTAKITRLRHY